MDLSNIRGKNKMADSPSAKSDNGSDDKKGAKNPKNIMETDTWKKSKSGVLSMWSNYVDILSRAFQNYSREEQERLITTMSQVVTIGCATVLITLFYPFIPKPIILVAVPTILFGSWFVATRVVSSIIISQFDDKLNKR